jgi:hypothetical protein
MSDDKNEVNVLDELNKGLWMGMDAISCILDKIDDKNLKETLEAQYNSYQSLAQKLEKIYPEYSNKEPHKDSTIDKLMIWSGVQMKTMTDHSASKIAELFVKGTNMGIIEGRKLLNHKNTDTKVHPLIEEYVTMQENAVEKLKKFL